MLSLSGRILQPSRLMVHQRPNLARMCSSSLSRNRNIGIVAHVDAGKTTTSEYMLYLCGSMDNKKTVKVGRVDTGDTVLDYLPQERERGITIQSAATTMHWKDCKINLIDTPGHVDFTVEVERCARVLDGVVLIIDAVSGVQAQTRTVWKQTRRNDLPAILFVNKMDRLGSHYQRALDSVISKLYTNVVSIQLPVGEEDKFEGVIDLITLKKHTYEMHTDATISDLNEEELALALPAREAMLESLAECDESFMDSYLHWSENDSLHNLQDEQLTQSIVETLRELTLSGEVIPALCGASLRGKGVDAVLDAVQAYLPSPLDRPPVEAVRQMSDANDNDSSADVPMQSIDVDSSEFCSLAFKIIHDPMRGPLVFVRTYAGLLKERQVLYNATQQKKERVNQILHVSADELDQTSSLGAGEVACLVGLKHTKTGDTLVTNRGKLMKYVLKGLHLPAQVFALSIEPERTSQQQELEDALEILCMEDPSLIFEIDAESGQNLLRGLGELHLEIVVDKLMRRFNIEVTTGDAYIAYRESLDFLEGNEEAMTQTQVYDRTISLKRLYSQASLTLTPLSNPQEPASLIISDQVKSSLSVEEMEALSDGLQAGLDRGPRGYPVLGLTVIVNEIGKDIDTTPGAIRANASSLLNKMLSGQNQALLEPLMRLELEVPSAYVGDVLSDLTVKRRAHILEIGMMEEDNDNHNPYLNNCIIAQVPLANMLGYATIIRSMTQGEGSFSMEFDQFSSPMNEALVKEVLMER